LFETIRRYVRLAGGTVSFPGDGTAQRTNVPNSSPTVVVPRTEQPRINPGYNPFE
jgi:hypothetical protein